jgi:hemerythrin superfamily protein
MNRGRLAVMDRQQPVSSTGQRLLSDHQRLDSLFDRLLKDVRRGDWATCQATWARFERELLEHLEAEETFLLPTFESEHPDETATLRREHANIRRLLADMGVKLELHAEREQNVRRFVESLQSHAAREEALLYRWADHLPLELAQGLAERLRSHEATPVAPVSEATRG